MNGIEPDHLRRRRQRNPNTAKPKDIAMIPITTILTTSKGWIIRQALKATGSGLATFGAYVMAKATTLGVPLDKVDAMLTPFQAFVSAAVVVVIEVVLSFLARKNP
jgi:hypothetical protein